MMVNENIWRSEKLKQFSNLNHGPASRYFGRLSIANGPTQEVISNRQRLAEDAGFDLKQITMVKQTHSNIVHVIENCDIGNALISER